MSNLSDIKHIADHFDSRADAPAPVNMYPLLGLGLVLASAALTCGLAYLALAG